MSDKQRNRYFPKIGSYDEMVRAAPAVTGKPRVFQKGDFVYLDKIPGQLAKGTGEKRSEICIINQVINAVPVRNVDPVRYRLLNLNFKVKTGTFYAQNLRLVPESERPTSTSTDYFK